MKTGQVFISHTSDMARFPEGRSFVQAALDAVSRAGLASVDMRYFAARDGQPAEYCRARVHECDIYVAIVGHRYGSMVPREAVSYTELEFQAASEADLPRLVFLLEADELPQELPDTDRQPVERFRQRLCGAGLMVRGFSSADGLELEVFHALSELANDRTAGPRAGAAHTFAGGVAAATRTLPRDIASFTGRDPEIRVLLDAVGSGGVIGIHAIGGMAGIGKTAFAVHAAHQLAPLFPDGQIFVPLHAHTPGQRAVDPADALASILLTAGVAPRQIPPGLEARARLWRDHVADKRLLLLLDDAAGHEQIRPLMPGTAGSMVLVTSRRHLTALEDAQTINLDTLPPDEAAELLIHLAARPGLAHDDPAVQEIGRLCGYLPLAVGMLARQLHHHPAWAAADLAADLAAACDRLELMKAENLSVAAAFDLSYQDLGAAERRLFRRLGLHPGTEVDAYAAAALDDANFGLDAVRRSLATLYDHYLLVEPVHGRYRMHDLIREHARALAAADADADSNAAMDRLLDYYLDTARSADLYLAFRTHAEPSGVVLNPPAHSPRLTSWDEAVAWMETERLNLHAAAGYAAAHGRPGHAVAIPAGMHAFLRGQGHWDQALHLYQVALDAARGAGDQPGEAIALTDLGHIQYQTGSYPAAEASLTQALELCRRHGDRLGEAYALNRLGAVWYFTGDYTAATASLTLALELSRDQGDRLIEANALQHLGSLQHGTGAFDDAIANLTRAFELYHDVGSRLGEANSLHHLGAVHWMTGDYPSATASLVRALDLHRAIGDKPGEADSLKNLGAVQEATGDYPAAIASLSQALELCRHLGSRLGEAHALRHMSAVQRSTGDYPVAIASATRALGLYRDLGSRLGEADALSYLGAAQNAAGDYPAAMANLTSALDLYRNLGVQDRQAEALSHMGMAVLASASPTPALALFEQALTIAASIASPREEARALEGMGRYYLRTGHPDQGFARLRQALAIYQRIGSPHAMNVEETLNAQR
jgi:tetratricopeptide (TPR) repeat protein